MGLRQYKQHKCFRSVDVTQSVGAKGRSVVKNSHLYLREQLLSFSLLLNEGEGRNAEGIFRVYCDPDVCVPHLWSAGDYLRQ